MNDYFDELLERDERTRSRQINGTHYTIKATDPYGHWHVEKIADNHPLAKQTWTSAMRAWEAVQSYENAKAHLKSQIKEAKNKLKTEE